MPPDRREPFEFAPASPENTPPMLPYPALRDHAIIGDRRMVALTAADGTIDWMGAPRMDGPLLFGALLDANTGGYWRLGPAALADGRQSYVEHSGVLVTAWEGDGWELDLTDALAWPEDERPGRLGAGRALLRRLRCSRGSALCASNLVFNPRLPDFQGRIWSNRPNLVEPGTGRLFTLSEGEAVWIVMDVGEPGITWSTELAQETLLTTAGHWQSWQRRLGYSGPRAGRVSRAAMTIRMLTPMSGTTMSSPTTSLPRRWGGSSSGEGRVSRLTDVAAAINAQALVGDMAGAARQLDAVCAAAASGGFPGLFGVHGERDISERIATDYFGYHGTLPVRFGARYQPAGRPGLGFFADALNAFIRAGGEMKPAYAAALASAADLALDWRSPDRGLWDVRPERHYVGSVAMSWVALDRAVKLLGKTADAKRAKRWRTEREAAMRAILRDGWSDRLQSFRGVMGEDVLEPAALLLSVFDVLPGDDVRLVCTLDRLAEHLSVDGYLYRFRPPLAGRIAAPLGEVESASTVATLWAAGARAKTGRPELGEILLQRLDNATPLGLLSEFIDPRGNALLGNAVSALALAEYIRAVHALARARPIDKLKLLVGEAERRLLRRAEPAWDAP